MSLASTGGKLLWGKLMMAERNRCAADTPELKAPTALPGRDTQISDKIQDCGERRDSKGSLSWGKQSLPDSQHGMTTPLQFL